jgi:hypothetical protein
VALRVVNAFPRGRVTPPVVTRSVEERTPVTVAIEWDDGRVLKTLGVIVSLSPEATLVELVGPDGRRRREWFLTHLVHRR